MTNFDKELREIFEKLIIDHYWDSLNTEKELVIKHFVEGILPLAIFDIKALIMKEMPKEREIISVDSDEKLPLQIKHLHKQTANLYYNSALKDMKEVLG